MVEFCMVGLGLHRGFCRCIGDHGGGLWVTGLTGLILRRGEGELGGIGEGTEFADVAAARVNRQTRKRTKAMGSRGRCRK